MSSPLYTRPSQTIGAPEMPNCCNGVFPAAVYGAVGDGVSDDTGALQMALDACLLSGGRFMAEPLTYRITDTLVIENADANVHAIIDFGAATILLYEGLGVPAIRIGSPTARTYNVDLLGGDLRMAGRDWTDTIGLQMYHTYYCGVDGLQVRGFGKGIELRAGDAGYGCVYNNISPAVIVDCLWGIYLEHTLTGWTNENYFSGDCKIYYSTSLNAVDCSAGAAIYAKGISGSNVMNGHTFIGLSLECASSIADKPASLDLDVQSTTLIGIRYEGFGYGHIHLGGVSASNQFIGGYETFPDRALASGSEGRATFIMGKQAIFTGGHGTYPAVVVRETNSYANKCFVVRGTSNDEEFAIDGAGTLHLNQGPTIRAAGSNPENIYPGEIGSIYLRTTGSTGTTLYVKESDPGGTTGWVAK